jgi:hypothetical protein
MLPHPARVAVAGLSGERRASLRQLRAPAALEGWRGAGDRSSPGRAEPPRVHEFPHLSRSERLGNRVQSARKGRHAVVSVGRPRRLLTRRSGSLDHPVAARKSYQVARIDPRRLPSPRRSRLEQGPRAAGSTRAHRDLRAALVVRTIEELQRAGVEPHIWKIEGLEAREDCELVVDQAQVGERKDVRCVVLGRGADRGRVAHWLKVAAPVAGYLGLAIGPDDLAGGAERAPSRAARARGRDRAGRRQLPADDRRVRRGRHHSPRGLRTRGTHGVRLVGIRSILRRGTRAGSPRTDGGVAPRRGGSRSPCPV